MVWLMVSCKVGELAAADRLCNITNHHSMPLTGICKADRARLNVFTTITPGIEITSSAPSPKLDLTRVPECF